MTEDETLEGFGAFLGKLAIAVVSSLIGRGPKGDGKTPPIIFEKQPAGSPVVSKDARNLLIFGFIVLAVIAATK
jgi:hypothetical protein